MLRTIGRAEVLLHNTTEDLWVIIDGYVYDLSKFKDLHPGGAPPLKFVAGKDASDAFYGLHRSSILKEKRFERLRVGRVAGYTPPPTPPPTPYSEPLFIRKHSPYYNDSHHKLRRDVRAFIDEHIAPTAADDDEFGEDPSMELNVAMGNAGILAAIVGPEAAQLGFSHILLSKHKQLGAWRVLTRNSAAWRPRPPSVHPPQPSWPGLRRCPRLGCASSTQGP